ncbi:hypothetical protein BDZ45DRAFT_159242 [Acephala macrosclerotiorum]|nr:hypothetical protein BDZ45DRAFT_159242 [Acephala macrosclerotiorum]
MPSSISENYSLLERGTEPYGLHYYSFASCVVLPAIGIVTFIAQILKVRLLFLGFETQL